MSVAQNIAELNSTLPENVTLIAVSKTKPVEVIQEAYDGGQRVFGENKVQEMVDKFEKLPNDIQWHLIGHLQSNKVKYIAPFVSLIHSVDSLKLLQEIDKQAKKNNRVIPCLLQFHIASEETKFGLNIEEATEILQDKAFVEMENVEIVGVMGMASFTEDENIVRDEFQTLHSYFALIKSHFFKLNPNFKHISMGMSGDYEIAIEEGSTMIRVGSKLFGGR